MQFIEFMKIVMKRIEWNINPVSKPRMTRRDKWKKRPVVQQYYGFKDEINLLAKKDKFVLPEEYEIEFYIAMPKSWSNVRKLAMDGKPHKNRPDLDNFIKAFQDALMDEDSYVWHVEAKKFWSKHGQIVILLNSR